MHLEDKRIARTIDMTMGEYSTLKTFMGEAGLQEELQKVVNIWVQEKVKEAKQSKGILDGQQSLI